MIAKQLFEKYILLNFNNIIISNLKGFTIKKYTLLLILPLLLFGAGDADKGQTYYFHLIKPELEINGATFARMHTTSEWEILFENSGQKFKIEFGNKSKKLDELFGSKKFNDEIMPHLKAFAETYSKDSNKIAGCDEPK